MIIPFLGNNIKDVRDPHVLVFMFNQFYTEFFHSFYLHFFLVYNTPKGMDFEPMEETAGNESLKLYELPLLYTK